MFRKEGRIGKKKTRAKRKYAQNQEYKIDIKPVDNNTTTINNMDYLKEAFTSNFERRLNFDDARTEGVHNSDKFQNCAKFPQNIPNYESVISQSMQPKTNFWLPPQQIQLQENLAKWVHEQEFEKFKMNSIMLQIWNQAITEKLMQAILS